MYTTVCHAFIAGTNQCPAGTSPCASVGSLPSLPLVVAAIHLGGATAADFGESELAVIRSTVAEHLSDGSTASSGRRLRAVSAEQIVVEYVIDEQREAPAGPAAAIGLVVVVTADNGDEASLANRLDDVISDGVVVEPLREAGVPLDAMAMLGSVQIIQGTSTGDAPAPAANTDGDASWQFAGSATVGVLVAVAVALVVAAGAVVYRRSRARASPVAPFPASRSGPTPRSTRVAPASIKREVAIGSTRSFTRVMNVDDSSGADGPPLVPKLSWRE